MEDKRDTSLESSEHVVWNVPNVLTMARIAAAPALFALLGYELYLAGLILFAAICFTDWLDGWWARTFDQRTKLGRILDPLADKVVVCGAFIFLAAAPGSGIVPWMATALVVREMTVTTLRSLVEAAGGDFSASLAGKAKMVLQCAALGASLALLAAGPAAAAHWSGWPGVAAGLVWLALAATLYSGMEYIWQVARGAPPRTDTEASSVGGDSAGGGRAT